MPLPEIFSAKVDERGRIPRETSEAIRESLRVYAGRDVVITVSPPKRSQKANAWLWAVVYESIRLALLDAGTPMSSEAIHECMTSRYLPATIAEDGTISPPSTAEMDRTSFYDYVERVRTDEDVLALEVYIETPDQDELTFMP